MTEARTSSPTGDRRAAARALNDARERKGLSYRALSRATGVSVATLQGWMSGKYVPQIGMSAEFERLVQALDLADATDREGIEALWAAIRGQAPVRNIDLESPYPGMQPFDLRTAHLFPGRTTEVDALHTLISRRLDGQDPPLLVVTGRSGTGKSSLVAAAVHRCLVAGRTVGVCTSLADAINRLERIVEATPDAEDIIVIDQAESLWRTNNEHDAQRVLTLIDEVHAAAPPVAILFVMRADAIAPATDVPVLRRALETAHFVLGSITRADAREIILSPTSSAGISVDDDLVRAILADAGADPSRSESSAAASLVGALPLLSQTMRTLWEGRGAASRITLSDYLHSGGLASAVETAAESAFATLSPAAQTVCWPVLRELIRLDGDGPTRRTVALSTFDDPPSREVIDTLTNAHLLTTGDAGVRIGHDLLMTMWPRLAEWLADTQDWNATRRVLARYAVLWDDSGRPDDLLTTGVALGILSGAQDSEGAAFDQCSLSRVERDFIDASSEAQLAGLRAAEEEAISLRLTTRRLRSTVALATLLLIVAVVLGAVAWGSAGRLAQVRTQALSGELASRSQVVSDTMPAEGAQLAIAALGVDENATTRSALLSLTAGALPRQLPSVVGPGTLAATDTLLFEGGSNGAIRVLDSTSGELLHTIETPFSHVYALDQVESGGRVLLAASGEDVSGDPAQGCVWEVSGTPSLIGCASVPSKSDSAALLPDGSGALFGGADGTIRRLLIDGNTATELSPVTGPRIAETAAAIMGLDAAGSRVAAATVDGSTATLTDPLGEAVWSPVTALPQAQRLRLSDDGERFAIPTREFTVVTGTFEEDGTPTQTDSFGGFESWATDAAFLDDGGIAAVASDQTLRMYTSDGESAYVQALPSLPTTVVRTGGGIATYTVNGTTTIWPADFFPLPSERGRVFEVATDGDDGTLVATVGSGDGLLRVDRVLDDGAHRALAVPKAVTETRYGIAVSPDGAFIATGGYGKVHLWRVDDDALSEPTVIDALPGALITYMKFSPDGARLAVGDQSADEVLIFDLGEDLGSGGANVSLTQTATVPVMSAGTMAFVDGDTFVVHDGSWQLAIWNVETDQQLGTVDLDGQYPVAIATRPDHPTQIAFATESLAVGIVDITDPAQPDILARVDGLTDTPRGIGFSQDGSQLAIATVGHVDVRDVSEDGTDLGPSALRLSGPMRTEITDAKFVGADSQLVASTYSGLTWWWSLDTDAATERICAAVGAPLSTQDAQALAPSLPDDARMCADE